MVFPDLLWRVRGWLDTRLGGVGMGRGRRDPDVCAVGDVIDGWTVEAYEPDRRLRLSSDWKLPGRAWLEFEVTPLDGGRRSVIRQTATFDPRGLLGRAYWYALVPSTACCSAGCSSESPGGPGRSGAALAAASRPMMSTRTAGSDRRHRDCRSSPR